jgi:hypothetical protein
MPNTLNKYQGKWELEHTKHAFNRLSFGTDYDSLIAAKKNGLEKSIDALLNFENKYDAPVNNYSNIGESDETGISFGISWVNAGWNNDLAFKRKTSFRNWIMIKMAEEKSAKEKMILFWHHHFSTELEMYRDARYSFLYYEILRNNAFGNFKNMVKEISLTPAMLLYLNSVDNKVGAPDENFARELQELFTIGKEYEERYTEEDVQEAAKVLTGYTVTRNAFRWDLTYTFVPNRHDTSDKKFTAFYDNKTILGQSGMAGQNELDELLEMIFAKEQVSEHICRNLYRFFVHSEIDDAVEIHIIKPLSKLLRDSNYELRPVYDKLFKSEHFFDPKFFGSMIKNPIEYVAGPIRQFNALSPDTIKEKYAVYNQVFGRAARMQLQVGDPPNVSGWPAFYQAPSFYKIWINSATLGERTSYIKQMLLFNGFVNNSVRLRIDHVNFASKIPNVDSPEALLSHLSELMFSVPLSSERKATIAKDILLDGEDDPNRWAETWQNMTNNPSNQSFYLTVERKLKTLFNHLAQLPEYHLC